MTHFINSKCHYQLQPEMLLQQVLWRELFQLCGGGHHKGFGIDKGALGLSWKHRATTSAKNKDLLLLCGW